MSTTAVIAFLFIRPVSFLSSVFFWIAAILLVVAVLTVGQMVVIRYVFAGSTVWQTEFVTYATTAAIFLATPRVLLTRGHVRVSLLSEQSSPKWRLLWDSIADILSAVFLFLLAIFSWLHFREAWIEGWVTDSIWALPLWIPLLPLPVSMFLAALQCCAEILRSTINNKTT